MAGPALITGIEGFTGRYVAQELAARGYEVIGLARAAAPGFNGLVCDLGDRDSLRATLEQLRPSVVVHLAGISNVTHGDVGEIYRSNIVATRNLFEALARNADALDVVLLPSSAHVYGPANDGVLTEQSPFAPHNDYAVSKVGMEYMARLWIDRLPLVVTRPFNYTGVGQSASFLVPKIVDHFRRRADSITLGNLDVSRDFTDVRDLATCYGRLIEAAPTGRTINVCSDRTYSLREILDLCAEITGHRMEIASDPQLMRPGEVQCLRGSNVGLLDVIGHYEFRPLRDTLAWMLASG